MDNECKNCCDCICLSCEKRDNCRCDLGCNDNSIKECVEVIYDSF